MNDRSIRGWISLLLILLYSTGSTNGNTGEQQLYASLGRFILENGEVLEPCRIGYRMFGSFNRDTSNVVLFPTWFGGKSSHLSGLMGKEGLIDTSVYCVIAVDALGNGVSSSPSNHPAVPDSLFPGITIYDMVRSQHLVLEEVLGVKQLYAVIGGSMGGMQVFQWVASYPNFMTTAISYVGTPYLTSQDKLLWQTQLTVIEYAQASGWEERIIADAVSGIQQMHLYTPGFRAKQTPSDSFRVFYHSIQEQFRSIFYSYDWAAQLRAMLGHDIRLYIRATDTGFNPEQFPKMLVFVSDTDHMVNPNPSIRFQSEWHYKLVRFKNDCGHLAPGCESDRFFNQVRDFLQK